MKSKAHNKASQRTSKPSLRYGFSSAALKRYVTEVKVLKYPLILIAALYILDQGWLPFGGAPWFILGPERLRVENNSGKRVESIKIIDTKSNEYKMINNLELNSTQTVRISGGNEPHYQLVAQVDGKEYKTDPIYTETGECIIYSIEENHVTDRKERITDLCFWF